MKPTTIVFIHGMYMTPLCWENWITFFQSKGYKCVAPPWPGRDRPLEELRKSASVAGLTLAAILDEMETMVKALGEKPVIVGHSMGALVSQILLQRDLSAATVTIDSAPPQGLLSIDWPFLKSNWPHTNPFISKNKPARMSLQRFQYTFVNSLPPEEQRAAYDRYVVPESRRVPAGSLTGIARIDFKKAHAPLLIIAGSNDHIIPSSLCRKLYSKYKASPSQTDFKEFPGRTHFIIGQKGWEDVASFVASWLDKVLP